MLVGREREKAALQRAIAERRSLLIYGPSGAGKSVLLDDTFESMTAGQRESCVRCAAGGSPELLWRRLVRALADVGDSEVLARVEGKADSHGAIENWLNAQTSLRLRGVLRKAMRGHDYSVFLDATEPLADGAYRLLQEWTSSGRTPVVLLGRGSAKDELGRAAQLYWHEGMRLQLGALEVSAAQALLDLQLELRGISRFADDEFRRFVLEQSQRLPGGIIRLCEMASQTAYQHDDRVKLHILAVDFLIQKHDRERRVASHA